MATTGAIEPIRTVVTMMTVRDAARLFVGGALTGVIAALLYIIFDRFILSDQFCATTGVATAGCANKVMYISIFALVIAQFVSLFVLVRQRIYRPLLVVLLAAVSLWGVLPVAASLPVWVMVIVVGVLFGLAYLAFGWLVQLRNFIITVILGIIAVIAMRLLFMA